MPRQHTEASRGEDIIEGTALPGPGGPGLHRHPMWTRRAPRGVKPVAVAALALAVGGLTTVAAIGVGEAAPRVDPVSKPGPGVAAAPQVDATVPVVADTHVVQERPTKNYGAAARLNAASYPQFHSTTYLRFDVQDVPAGVQVAQATIVLTAPEENRQRLTVHPVAGAWSENTLTYATAPVPGPAIARSGARGDLRGGPTLLSLDVTAAVQRAGSFSFAVRTAGDRAIVRPYSRESENAPVLELSWSGTAPTAEPSAPPSSAPPSSAPTPRPSSPVPSPSGTPSTPPTAPPAPPAPGPPRPGGALFGATVWPANGEGYAAALARADRDYGGLDTVRVFYPGAPAAWPGSAGLSGRPVVVSFKHSPAAVAAGAHDDAMAAWFRSAPRDRDVYWIFYHEPEENIEKGDFTAEQYRAAWRRLAELADRAGNPRLKATLNLMCWSLSQQSGRDWRSYYPGSDVIDVLAYDCYNYGVKKGVYTSPEELFGRAIAHARSLDKPWGIAEMGSKLAPGDDGRQRAAWLRKTGAYLDREGVTFATYFDAPVGGEFRLFDEHSKAAWREFAGR